MFGDKRFQDGYREGYAIGFQDGYAKGRVMPRDPAVMPCPPELASEWGITPGTTVRLVRSMDGTVISIMPLS